MVCSGVSTPITTKTKDIYNYRLLSCIPITGWLADIWYGNFKVFRFGALLFFVSTVLTCICLIIEEEGVHPTLTRVAITVALLGSYLGVSACIVTALQLGLDQMPDASSDNIISFIKWFIFSAFFGVWISDIILRSAVCTKYNILCFCRSCHSLQSLPSTCYEHFVL